jgi:hypothetical protein
MKNIIISFTLFCSLFLLSCQKNEGQGGTSIIKGKLLGKNHSSAKAEVTEVIFTNGLEVEHGDYWLLNSPSNNEFYYIWYNNPTWVSNGNPNLEGRTGIKVDFNYSDSNVEIALNTKQAIESSTNLFNLNLVNDVITISNTLKGECPDHTDVTTPFDFNVVTQGKNSIMGEELPLNNEKVYISFGTHTSFDDDVQTTPDGMFIFKNLTKGKYKVSYFNKDTITGMSEIQQIEVEITKNKSENDVETLHVIY